MKPFLASLAGTVLAGLALSAPAGAVPLVNGDSLVVTAGGIQATFTVANCTTMAGACSGAAQLVQDGTKLGTLIESATGGQLVDLGDDLTFDLDISTTKPVGGMRLGMTGAGIFTSVGEVFSNGAPSISVSPGGSLTAYSAFPSPTTAFTVSKDAQPLSIRGEAAYVTSITQDLAVPEPASAGLLAFGLGLSALLRRRRSA